MDTVLFYLFRPDINQRNHRTKSVHIHEEGLIGIFLSPQDIAKAFIFCRSNKMITIVYVVGEQEDLYDDHMNRDNFIVLQTIYNILGS